MRGIKINEKVNICKGSSRQSAMTALRIALICLIFSIIALPSLRTEAKGNVHTGSFNYTSGVNEPFYVGIYTEALDGDVMGDFELKVSFDPNFLVCIEEDGENNTGETIIKDTSWDGFRVKTMLMFRPVAGGDTVIEVKEAVIRNNNGEELEMNDLPSVPVYIDAPAMTLPSWAKINGEEVKDFEEGVNEYEISIPYTESFSVTFPSEYKVICDTETLSEGLNTVNVILLQDGFMSVKYTFNITMEAKPEPEPIPEEVVEEEPEEPAKPEGMSDEETERELIREALKKSSEKTKNPEIEALNLKGMMVSVNNNQAEIKAQKKKSVLILLGFAGIIVLIVAFKFIYDFIRNNDRGIKRQKQINFGVGLSKKAKAELFSFADIESKKSASAKYFEYGLDEKIKEKPEEDARSHAGKHKRQ